MERKIIQKYVDLVIKRGIFQEEGNSKESNKLYDKIEKYRKTMKDNMELYIEDLKNLLNHENDYVRLTTAFTLLPFLEKKSEDVLEKISIKRGLVGFSAKMILQEWKKGNLKP